MTAKEIVDELAKERFLENLASKYDEGTPYKEDLVQEMYIYLLEKVPEEKLVNLYERGELKWYLSTAVKWQIISNKSYYRRSIRSCGINGEVFSIDDNKTIDILDEENNINEKVQEFLSSLPEIERDCIMLLAIPQPKRGKHVKKFLEKYNLEYKQYKKMLPEMKYKFMKYFKNDYKKTPTYKREKSIAQLSKYGKLIKEFSSVQEASDELKIPLVQIMRVLRGERTTCRKFQFKYLD